LIKFTWDPNKEKSNQQKHGVSFEEAKTAFSDENGRVIFDPDHSDGEDRFILLGISLSLKILVVCHCYHESDSEIRIISARKATKRETGQYKEFLS